MGNRLIDEMAPVPRLIGLLLGVSATAMSTSAAAQQAVAADASAGTDAGAPIADTVPAETIVVTGSRIQKQGYNAPTPLTVLNAEELVRKAPSNVPDASPAFRISTPAGASSPIGMAPSARMNESAS